MEHERAVALIAGGLFELDASGLNASRLNASGRSSSGLDATGLDRASSEVWADLGAGTGTFARALSDLLGPAGTVIAVDRDQHALRQIGSGPGAPVRTLRADFRRPLELTGLAGVLLANALHFVNEQEAVLRRVVGYLATGGRVVFVEYDLSQRSPWNPYPLPYRRLQQLSETVGLRGFRELGRQPSRFGGRELYAAVAVKVAAKP